MAKPTVERVLTDEELRFADDLDRRTTARFGRHGRVRRLHGALKDAGVQVTEQAVGAWLRRESVPTKDKVEVLDRVLGARGALLRQLGYEVRGGPFGQPPPPTADQREAFGRALDKAMRRNDMGPGDLADAVGMGVDAAAVERWVSGERVPRPFVARLIEGHLQTRRGQLTKLLGLNEDDIEADIPATTFDYGFHFGQLSTHSGVDISDLSPEDQEDVLVLIETKRRRRRDESQR